MEFTPRLYPLQTARNQKKYISFSDLYRQLRSFFGSGAIEEKLKLTLEYAVLPGFPWVEFVYSYPPYPQTRRVIMRDTELYRHLLGLLEPWTVEVQGSGF
jgi:hypothetical protein